VEPDDYFSKLDALDEKREAKFKSPQALLENCIEGVTQCYNSRVIMNVKCPCRLDGEAQPGIFSDHNSYMIMVDFSKRLRFQNSEFTKKIRRKIGPKMEENFSEFDLKEFTNWIAALGDYTQDEDNTEADTDFPVKTAKVPLRKEKHKQAMEKDICFSCKTRKCFEDRLTLAQQEKKNVNKMPCNTEKPMVWTKL
jgi:hypothetical protein